MPTEESNLTTTTVTVENTEQQEMRMYTDGSQRWPSVSEVLNFRNTPAKDSGLNSWRKYMYSQDRKPNPDDLMQFKSARGTLAHYTALNELVPYELASDDEAEAYETLRDWEYRHSSALRQAKTDIKYFLSEWHDMLDDREIEPNNVRSVEKAVYDNEYGYAGRFDLCYEHPTRGTVVADLKTTNAKSMSHILDKKWPRYGMQLAAYARAVEYDVDAIEVLWASPDKHASSCITGADMPLTRDAYEQQFLNVADRLHTELNK